METKNLKCPTCGQTVMQNEMLFTCAEHGDWVLYGANLLVRKPNVEQARRDLALRPWESRILRAA